MGIDNARILVHGAAGAQQPVPRVVFNRSPEGTVFIEWRPFTFMNRTSSHGHNWLPRYSDCASSYFWSNLIKTIRHLDRSKTQWLSANNRQRHLWLPLTSWWINEYEYLCVYAHVWMSINLLGNKAPVPVGGADVGKKVCSDSILPCHVRRCAPSVPNEPLMSG